jgi:hypothetical protein
MQAAVGRARDIVEEVAADAVRDVNRSIAYRLLKY